MVDPQSLERLLGFLSDRPAVRGGDSGGGEKDLMGIAESARKEPLARNRFSHGAAAGVSGADEDRGLHDWAQVPKR